MNGRDLLRAIAEIDEDYIWESADFDGIADGIRAARTRNRRACAAVGVAAVLGVAVFGMQRRTGRTVPRLLPAETTANEQMQTEPSATASADPATETQKPETKTTETRTTETRTTETPGEPQTDPPTEQPTEPPTEPPTEAATQSRESPDGPGAVLSKRGVGYEEARERFGCPIVPCADEDFLGYRIGIVSRSGDADADGAFCLSVEYVFADGSVFLQDQDRMKGSSASALGEKYDYRGGTFYVSPPGGYAADLLHVGYYPTWDRGIAYDAVFAPDTDVYAVMDRILSLAF